MAAPWILLTDQPPAAVSLEVYGLRVWIEQGFRILKRKGWHGHRTRPRAISVFRLGLTPLRRLCFQGRTWQGLWLRPESTSAPPVRSVTA